MLHVELQHRTFIRPLVSDGRIQSSMQGVTRSKITLPYIVYSDNHREGPQFRMISAVVKRNKKHYPLYIS